jgi:hypothetical protein
VGDVGGIEVVEGGGQVCEAGRIGFGEAIFGKPAAAEGVEFGVGEGGGAMLGFEFGQAAQERPGFRAIEGAELGEQVLFFVGVMFWGGVAEVVEGGFEGASVFRAERAAWVCLSDAAKDTEEAFDAAMAIGKESEGVGEVTFLGSDGDGHKI